MDGRPIHIRSAKLAKCVALAALALAPATARGDGGQLQLVRDIDPWQVAVFAAPTPLRAGPIDVSVLVQDRSTGSPIVDAQVDVQLTERSPPGRVLHARASSALATNKLLQAAFFELPHAGQWDARLSITTPQGPCRLEFSLDATAAQPGWQSLWPWFTWPVAVVLLYVMHQALVARHSRRAGSRSVNQGNGIRIADPARGY